MCCTKWIGLTLAFTLLGVTSIDVRKSVSVCEVQVELIDRMIKVVNKDELCLCLKYEKMASPRKISDPCKLNTVHLGGSLIISADSMCECAGYETNSTLKYTTGSDIPLVTISKASTPDAMLRDDDRTETVTLLLTSTTTVDKVKDKVLSSNSSVTKVLDYKLTTNETEKVSTDLPERLTTDYLITTKIPFVYSFKNSSITIETGTTEEVKESKPMTPEPTKSFKLHIYHIGKNVTTDLTTEITTPSVLFTVGTKKHDGFYATNRTMRSKEPLTDVTRNSTAITNTTERTTVTKNELVDVKLVYPYHTTHHIDRSENTSISNVTHTTDKVFLVISNVTSSETDASTSESHLTTKDKVLPIFTKDTTKNLSIIVKNFTTTTNTTERSTTTKNEPMKEKHIHTSYIMNVTGSSENTSVPNITHTTDKLLLAILNVTSSETDDSTTESHSTTKGKLLPIFVKDTTENVSTTNKNNSLKNTTQGTTITENEPMKVNLSSTKKKDLTESTMLAIPETTIKSSTATDFGQKRVIPLATTSRNNYTVSTEPSRTVIPIDVIPNVSNMSTTEVTYHKNFTGTDSYEKGKAGNANVITKGKSTTTTPITIQSTTSSYTESDTIKGGVISYTNITLIIIISIICVILLILLIVKIIKSCLQKGSYVLPHESDQHIEMDRKK